MKKHTKATAQQQFVFAVALPPNFAFLSIATLEFRDRKIILFSIQSKLNIVTKSVSIPAYSFECENSHRIDL